MMNVDKLTSEEKSFTNSVINRLGAGTHPVATEDTLEYFKPSYVKRLLRRALKSGKLTPEGESRAKSVLFKLE